MAENVFEAVKQSVSTREAAAFYGIEVKRNGMACCPFHDDKNPSMKVDQRFHCFGCGADGDVIDFTAKLFDLSPKEAAEKLAQDFGLIYDSQAPPRRRYVRQKTEAQKFREDRQRCYRVLSDYYYLLKKWEADRSPRTPEEEPHPRFVEAIQKKTYVEYLLDLFLYESEEEQKAWIAEHTAEITHLERRLKIMAENKPTNRERLREITDGIEQGIKELFESEKYMRYLSVMSRFHRYSVNNTMLIYMQKPDATLVAGYNKWKDQFERHVKKGEHGITIIAPTPYKKKIEEQKLDPDTKAPILDKDGKIITEEKEIEIPMFRPVKVFDVSQTDGKPLPELASSLSGNVPNYEAFMEALRRSAPMPITFEAMAADTDGYFSADHQKIAIRQGMSEVQTVSATVHEIAHSKLHNQKKIQIANDEQYQEIELFDKPGLFSNGRIVRDNLPEGVYCYDLRGSDYDPGEPVCVEERVVVNHAGSVLLTDPLELAENGRLMLTEEEGLNFVGGFSTLAQFLQEQKKDRHTEEVEAESISYAVCKYFGIETGENSFGYIASWSQGKELKELRASLETINKTSGTLISDIERHYKEICKERGIDPNAKKEPEMAVLDAEANQQEALFLIDDATYLHIQPCDSGWDYTLYDAASMKELDGGQLDMPELSRMKAVLQICDDNDLDGTSLRHAPLSMIETLQEAAYQQMQEAADNYAFEEAARLRDQLQAVARLNEAQKAVTNNGGDMDIFGLGQDMTGLCVQLFFVRKGKLIGRDNFFMPDGGDTPQEVMTAFVKQYYNEATFIPKEVVLPYLPEEDEKQLIETWLADKAQRRVELLLPQRGVKKDLLKLANENAVKLLNERLRKGSLSLKNDLQAAEELQQALGLEHPLERMDCFDISHTQGSETVASMVVFRNGTSSKKDYRRYKIVSAEGKPDDFKSMQEVVYRRYRDYEDLPSLVVIDGGKGQLSSALEVIRGLGLDDLPVVGLAKREEEIFKPNQSESIMLDREGAALHLIQRIRDEAHRFAITYHRKLRGKRNLVSVLDHVEGIGPKRRQELWKAFKTLDAMRAANVEELAAVEGMNHAAAQTLYDFFRLDLPEKQQALQ